MQIRKSIVVILNMKQYVIGARTVDCVNVSRLTLLVGYFARMRWIKLRIIPFSITRNVLRLQEWCSDYTVGIITNSLWWNRCIECALYLSRKAGVTTSLKDDGILKCDAVYFGGPA